MNSFRDGSIGAPLIKSVSRSTAAWRSAQFLSGGAGPLVNPVFDATIQYNPFEQTRISITGQRTVSASYLQDQVTETTGVTASLNQRLLGKYFLDLNGSYQFVKYVTSGTIAAPNRER